MNVNIDIDENVYTAQIIYSKEMDKYLQVVVIPKVEIENQKRQLEDKLSKLNIAQSEEKINK